MKNPSTETWLVDLQFSADDQPPRRVVTRTWAEALGIVLAEQVARGPVAWARLEKVEAAL